MQLIRRFKRLMKSNNSCYNSCIVPHDIHKLAYIVYDNKLEENLNQSSFELRN